MFSMTTVAVAQKQQHHHTGQHRAKKPFLHDRLQRISNVRRLVELVVDLDVGRNHRLKLREARFDFVDDSERRSIGALRNRNVDSAAPVHFGIAGDDVARIFDRADVAQEYRRACPGADR